MHGTEKRITCVSADTTRQQHDVTANRSFSDLMTHIDDIKRDEKRMEAFDAFFAVLEVSSGCWILSKAKNAMKRALYLPTATGNRWEQNTYCTL